MNKSKWASALWYVIIALTLVAVGVLFVLRVSRERQPMPPSPPAESHGEAKPIRVVASKRSALTGADDAVPEDVSSVIAVVCGRDRASANRYEVRNDALRSVVRRRDLPEGDVAALMAYVASVKGSLHPAREAALRNDVLNLLRDQKPVPAKLPRLLMDIVRKGRHGATLIDYAIQHLGALQHDLTDEEAGRVQEVLFAAASGIGKPYAGTALYALADARRLSAAESQRLRRLTVAACSSRANQLARLSALQLAGQRGYREVLPDVRAVLTGDRRDAVADTVAVGTLGLLGEGSDIELIESVAARDGSRLAVPCAAAVERIKGRMTK